MTAGERCFGAPVWASESEGLRRRAWPSSPSAHADVEARLLILDEPASGMNPAEKAGLVQLVSRIRDSGITVFFIEHDMSVVMGISDRIIVLDHGVQIAEGVPEEIQRNPRVIEAYLGREDEG